VVCLEFVAGVDVGAAEAAVGLAILINLFRLKKTVETDKADLLKH